MYEPEEVLEDIKRIEKAQSALLKEPLTPTAKDQIEQAGLLQRTAVLALLEIAKQLAIGNLGVEIDE